MLKTLDDPKATAQAKKQVHREPDIRALMGMSEDYLFKTLMNTSDNSFSDSQLTGSTIGSGSQSACEDSTCMRMLLKVPACENNDMMSAGLHRAT